MQRKEVEDRIILLGISGSHAYRTNVEGSDIDGRGIFIASKPYYLGFSEVEQKDGGWSNEPSANLGYSAFIDSCEDLTVYELRKYLRLAADANPNILELLWLADTDYEWVHPVGMELIRNRDIFLSTKVKYTYSGYAHAQLKRIEQHRKWLLEPPKKKPVPEDFGFDDRRVPLTKDQLHAFYEFLYMLVRDAVEFAQPAEDLYNILIARIDYKGLFKQHPLPPEVLPYVQNLTRATDEFIHLLQITQAYRAALHHWNSYEDWKTKRNPKRAETEARIGYDSKHGMHLIRLLRMGVEILNTGELLVDRLVAGDRDYLMEVRNCQVTYEQLMQEADRLKDEMESSMQTTSLAKSVDRGAINDLCVHLVERMGW